jgi:hypothetical protein
MLISNRFLGPCGLTLLSALAALSVAACGAQGGQHGDPEATDAAPIIKDSSCSGRSMWLFDTTDRTGNQICFDEAGTVNLAAYCRSHGWVYTKAGWVYRCTSTWAGAVKSFWSGALAGEFVAPQTGVDQGQFGCSESFQSDAAQGFTVADGCVQQATSLTLTNDCLVTNSNILMVAGGAAPYQLYSLTRSGATAASALPLPSALASGWPRDLTVDAQGRRAIYQFANDPALFVASGGSWTQETVSGADVGVPSAASAAGIAATPNGFFATDAYRYGGTIGGLVRFDGTTLAATRFAPGTVYLHLAMGFDGRLYALRKGTDGNNDGKVVDIFDPNSTALLGSVTLAQNVVAVAAEAYGSMFGAGWDGNIYRFDSSGAVVASLATGTPFGGLHDLKLASDGAIVVSSGSVYNTATLFVTDSNLASSTTISIPVPFGAWLTVFAAFDEPPPGSCAR